MSTTTVRVRETEPTPSFPLYHRLGAGLKALIESRHWIWIVLGLTLLLYLPFLFSGFFQDDYGFRFQFSREAQDKLGLTDELREVLIAGPLDLYGFGTHSDAGFSASQDKGFMPWWADQNIRTSFMRPLSSLSLALDFWLWPETPLLMHVHNLLWFGLLLVLSYQLYRSVSGSALVAGISILLLAVDDVFAGPAGWICNRHGLIAMSFGLLAALLYQRGLAQKKWPLIAGAYAVYAVALLSSEMGLVSFAYLFACAVVLDEDRWLMRAARLAPFILITVIWRLAYSALGYGATGTLLYIDPILDTADFITQGLTRYPLLIFSAAGLPLIDIMIAFAPKAAAITAALSLIPLGLLALVAWPLLKGQRSAAFWLIGLLCAAVPLVSGIPGNRNLGMVSLGVMALAGQLLAGLISSEQPGLLAGWQRWLLKLTTPLLLILHLVVSPLVVLNNPASTRTMAQDQMQVVNFGSDPALAGQHLTVINPPGEMIYIAGLFQRLFTDEPMPASLNYLTSGFAPVWIERVDEYSIRVRPEGGYTPLPGPIYDEASGTVVPIHLENVYRSLEENFYNPRNPMEVGQVVALSEVTIEVTGMTEDGRIAEALFTFDYPLEEARYQWLLWDKPTSSYERVEMPAVGESAVFE